MKIVKNGRLFGKLNIVDVLILLVVIAAVAFLAVRMVGGSGGETIAADEPSAQANLRYTVLCEDMPLMQAENAVTAVTAEDYELKLDDDSILKVSPNQIFNSNKFQDAQITSAEILPQDDSADGQRVTVSLCDRGRCQEHRRFLRRRHAGGPHRPRLYGQDCGYRDARHGQRHGEASWMSC